MIMNPKSVRIQTAKNSRRTVHLQHEIGDIQTHLDRIEEIRREDIIHMEEQTKAMEARLEKVINRAMRKS